MSADILEYLNEVDLTTLKKVFAYVRRRDIKVQFKTPDNKKVETVQFIATESPNKINLIFKNYEPGNEAITFKIVIGTDVYFFKSIVDQEDKDYFIYGPFKMFKLVRRKSTRYQLPENWTQSAFIMSPQKKTLNSKVHVIEIGSGGARVVVFPQLPRYEKGQQIQLSLKINKRSPLVIDAIIRHAKYSKLGGPTLGIEFILENQLLKNKIQNICDDLAYALAQNLAVKL